MTHAAKKNNLKNNLEASLFKINVFNINYNDNFKQTRRKEWELIFLVGKENVKFKIGKNLIKKVKNQINDLFCYRNQ